MYKNSIPGSVQARSACHDYGVQEKHGNLIECWEAGHNVERSHRPFALMSLAAEAEAEPSFRRLVTGIMGSCRRREFRAQKRVDASVFSISIQLD